MNTTEISPVIETATFAQGHPNTRMDYLYRDGNNYKQSTHVVMAGALTIEEATAIVDGLDEDDGFVPSAVGLDDLQERMVTDWEDDADHPFHEIDGISLTAAAPTTDMTAADFAKRFAEADWKAEGARVTLEHQPSDSDD